LQAAVSITGWVGEDRIRAELAAAHALVAPSFAEGLPMVVMEAMAAARPVIATYVAGNPELVQPGQTGWLVPAGDVAALAAGIHAMAETPTGDLRAMGLKGRDRVLQRHDIDAEAGRLIDLFTASVASDKKPAKA
jgi:glycosyltransferase involved in cell wall biosynthesis